MASAIGGLWELPARLASPVSLAEVMRRRRIPGVGVAVIAHGQPEWAGGFGVRSAEGADPVTADTLFQAGSISKPVAALCALRLVAEGHLELDGEVNDKLATWRIGAVGEWQPRVTLRHLLSHTAGLTGHGFPGYRRDEPAPSLVDILDGQGNTLPVRVRTVPGLQFSYSGGGYCVLQQLLVDVTGEPFPELARRLVLEPLGMKRSTYEQPLPESLHAEAAVGHRTGGGPVDGGWHVYPEMAAAGLWTTPSDLARVVLALQRARSGGEPSFLPPGLVDELLTPQAANVPMGLGMLLEGDGASRRFSHGGDDQGFVAKTIGYVENGLGAVVMTNSDDGYWVIEHLLEAMARAYAWPDYLPDEPPLRAASIEESDTCTGTYVSEEGQQVRVGSAGESLSASVADQLPIPIAPVSATEWHAVSLALTLTFEIGISGRAERMRLHQDAEYTQDVEFTRLV